VVLCVEVSQQQKRNKKLGEKPWRSAKVTKMGGGAQQQLVCYFTAEPHRNVHYLE
jgi:hypothetical protein